MSKVAEFRVSSKHTKIANRLRVVVYDNLKDVRKWGKWNGGEPYDENIFGVTNKQIVCNATDDRPIRIEAIIRLDIDHCGTGLVAHEVCHAAIYFFTQSGHRLHKNSSIETEEKFCYLYGDLFHEVTKKLHKKGIWR